MRFSTSPTGFSLAELLMVLLILGNIAAFTIPKVLSAQQNGTQKTVYRETFGAISEICYSGMLTGQLEQANAVSYVGGKLNAAKICSTSMTANGCRTQPMEWGFEGAPGLVLHSGMHVILYPNAFNPNLQLDVILDWNGDAGPNTLGQDELLVQCAISKTSGWWGKPGQVTPWNDNDVNYALYTNLFR